MKNVNNFAIQKGMFFVLLLAVFTLENTLAQDRWAFEFRPGVNIPVNDLGDANLKTGYGFEGTFSYRFMPHLSAYAGWGWNRFESSDSFAGNQVDFEETGYSYGLQFTHPIAQSNINFLARLGALYNHIEVENNSGEIIADSGHDYDAGVGWQSELGISMPLHKKWNFTTGIRYRSLPRDITIEGVTTSVDLQYVSFGIGFSRVF